ncbi:MAG: hypothetical protein E7636_05665 [Ruminococcaceae bacterium]|nr:hypothetical protein [Oscillospiraceae bacterium]
MTENEKFDWTETDRVMQQLRAQLEADSKNTDINISSEEQQVADATQPGAVAAALAEPSVSEVYEEPPVQDEQSNATEADAPVEEEVVTTADVPAVQTRPKARKKRRRMPKLDAMQAQRTDTALDRTALEEKKQRAAALAREQESDLYWRRTPVGKRTSQAAAQVFDVMPSIEDEAKKPALQERPSRTEEPIEQLWASRRNGIHNAAPEGQSKQNELLADITVEGLLNDIFGKTPGPAGRSWISSAEQAPVAEPVVSEENLTEALPEPAVTNNTPSPSHDSVADAPTVELDGCRVILPTEGELLPEENEKTVKVSQKTDSAKLFSNFFVKRQKQGALPKPSIAKLSADQMALKRALDESDEEFKFLVDLDYEDELGEAIGFEKILDYHERQINGKSRDLQDRRHMRGSKHKFEYTSHAQDIGISKFYAKQRRRHLINLTLTCLFMLLLFFYERSAIVQSFFGQAPTGAKYPTLYIVIGLVIFLCGVALLRRNLIGGLMQLLRLSPSDDSLCSVSVVATLAYHMVLLFAPAESKLSLFLSPAMGSLCLLALSGLFNWYRGFSAFRVISSKQQKYALMSRVSVGNREGNAKLRLFEKEQNERVWYVRPIGFVRNYFANTEKKTDHQRALGAALLFVMAISCAFSLYTLVVEGDLSLTLHTAFVTYLLTAPVISVLATSLPMFCATCLRLGRRGAIVGESAVYECGGNTTLVMPDSDCFKPMPHEQFELVKNCDAERATVLIRALLEKIGSPLCDTVQVPGEQRISPDAVTLTDIDEFGVAAVASGERKTPILFGSVAYLQKYGIRVSPKKDGRYEEICRNMLCVAINNRLTALFVAHYRPEDDMQTLVDMLEMENLNLKIRSKDPGIHDPLLRDLFADAQTPPRVMKPLVAESDITADRVDATVVALGSSREAAKALATCRRIRRAVKIGGLWQFASVLLGAMLCGACVLFGLVAALPAFAVTLYTFLFSGAHALTSYFILRDREENE